MWASVVMTLISLFSVMIIMRRFVMALIFALNDLYLFLKALLTIFFTYFSLQIKNFVLNHLYPVVMTSFAFFFTYFSFQIKSYLWEYYLKPSLQSFVQIVGSKLKALTTAAPLPSVQLISTLPIEFGREMFESRLQEALNFLRDDSQGVLGIWGMGGVGKTILLKHINNTLGKNPSSFGLNMVVLVTASRECTPNKIRVELAEKLGLREGAKTTDIFNCLNNKSFAILLDNLWGYLEFSEVGIPLPWGVVGDYKRKLILTSRSKRVCISMGAREHAALIEVDCLSTKDARLLFRSKVGEDSEEVIRSNLTIRKLSYQVADLCGRLPLVLNAVGRAMAGTTVVEAWEGAVDELRESKSKFFETREEIAGTEDDPLPILKFSYDHLKDPMKKECFLHCALWPEDFEIDIDELIRCWMGHGLLGKIDSLEKAYRKGHTIIDSLQQACLLEMVTKFEEFCFRNQHVKLHDVIRDMTLWIARDCGVNKNKWIVLAGQNLQESPQDEDTWREAHKISLMYNNIKSLPSNIQSTPNLTTLMLQSNYYLVDGGLMMSKYFDSLKYLDLSGCLGLECFPTEICGLTKLEYLNISNTGICSLPKELEDLVNMKYLIARTFIDHRVPPELLSKLINLIKLDLFWYGNTEDVVSSVIDNLDCLEGRLKGLGIEVRTISNLRKLVQLSRIPITALCLNVMEGLDSSLQLLSRNFLGSQHIQSNLKELTLSLCESVEEVVVEERHELSLNIERLVLFWTKGLKEIKWKGVEPRDVLPKLRRLTVSQCSALKSIEWVMYLPCLELLHVGYCEEMEQMFGKEGGAARTKQEEEDRPTFPSMRILTLNNMPNLSSICHRPLTFPSLEILDIDHCEQLKKLPFNSPSSCTKLRVIRCDEATWKGIDLEDNMQATFKLVLKPPFDTVE